MTAWEQAIKEAFDSIDKDIAALGRQASWKNLLAQGDGHVERALAQIDRDIKRLGEEATWENLFKGGK